jgi:hypothetical protein
MWMWVLILGGGPIAALAGLLAWRDHQARRRGGRISYLTSKQFDAQRVAPDNIPFGIGGGEVLPPVDP